MKSGDYALALYKLLQNLELVFFDDSGYCMNVIDCWLSEDMYEGISEGEADDIFERNATRVGWKLAFGEPFNSDSQHLDQLCASIKAARSLFPNEDGFIEFSSCDDET